MATNKPRFSITVNNEMLEFINDFQHENKMATQTKAVIALIERGIETIEGNCAEKDYNSNDISDSDNRMLRVYSDLSETGKKRVAAYAKKILDIEKADAELNEPVQKQATDINREIEMAKKRALEISKEFMGAQRDHSSK